ncbi:MATE family efflux transporter [Slackia heliotrinireducens]|uniref:MATE family efflux transporter n=1 Tax=Slackia heliotrinireducens TaxID=84110 RepID=UPI00331533C2
MAAGTFDISELREGAMPSRREMMRLVASLSMPAIMAELSVIIMQYIDAAMVGSLGAQASASIGLVETTLWLTEGLCFCAATGFTVQVAQLVGAGRDDRARNVTRQAILVLTAFSLVMLGISAAISGSLPAWLGGRPELLDDASRYFLIFSCALPAMQMIRLGTGVLQCSGDMRTPSALNILGCVLDVVFNWFLIFPTRDVDLFGVAFAMPGAGLGVTGAAVGTAASQGVVMVLMIYFALIRNPKINLRIPGSWRLERRTVATAGRLFAPMALERIVENSAYIATTVIVAPLGTIAMAAHTLAITAESLCYMPGYGIGAAATMLVGQAHGAGRRDLTRGFANFAVLLGMLLMAAAGVVLFVAAPYIMAWLTPDQQVRELGTLVLRIESFAEAFYGAQIVVSGSLRGTGDILGPTVINLACMWGLRIAASVPLALVMGLPGVWIAMAAELVVCGGILLVRLRRGKWLDRKVLAG